MIFLIDLGLFVGNIGSIYKAQPHHHPVASPERTKTDGANSESKS